MFVYFQVHIPGHHRGGDLHRGPGQAQVGAGRHWGGREGDGGQEEGRGEAAEGCPWRRVERETDWRCRKSLHRALDMFSFSEQ